MNIGFDAKRIFFNNSGLGNYGRRFYRALANNLPDDRLFLYSPKHVGDDNPYLKEILLSNSQITEPHKPLHRMLNGSLWRSGLVRETIMENKISIYYGLSNEIPYGLSRINMKKVVVIHDLIFLRYPKMYPSVDVYFYKKKTVYACKNSDHIIAASGQTKQDIIDFYHIPAEKISVLYPCSSSIFYQDNTIDSSHFFHPPRDYIISIGAITPRKNLMKSIQALNIVKDRLNLDLVVIGTAVGMGKAYLDKIMDYLNKHSLTDRVHFLDNVPYHLVPDLCRKAKVMVYPSQFEGFGMPIVEGLFSGIPVITSQGGCFPEAGGEGAIYVNPEDPEEIADWIEKLVTDPELRKILMEKGYKHAKRFRQDFIEDEIVAFHRSII